MKFVIIFFLVLFSSNIVLAEVRPIETFDETEEFTDDEYQDDLDKNGDDEQISEKNDSLKNDVKKIQENSAVNNIGDVSEKTIQTRRAFSRNVPLQTNDSVIQRRRGIVRGNSARQVVSRNVSRVSINGPVKENNRRIQQRANVSRAGSLYIPNASRLSIRTNNMQAGVRTSISTNVLGGEKKEELPPTPKVPQNMDETVSNFDKINQMNDFCKAQYFGCMDNFCNVVDDNQGRCSCSSSVLEYKKTEDALKKVKEELQDVGLKIKYIGLSKQEIETLFTQTEAEEAMRNKKDSSDIKKQLDGIKNMIFDVKDNIDTKVGQKEFGLFDLNIFNDDGFNFENMFDIGQNTDDNNTFVRQRGEGLYNVAINNCQKSVLNSCQRQGVDVKAVQYSYKLDIDKQCVAYEKNLIDANDKMRRIVKNAKNVLQRARLMVAQQKNMYDFKQCVNELDKCMTDDFICGANYKNCLDPTGQYIIKGEVVLGSDLSGFVNLADNTFVDKGTNNAQGTQGTLDKITTKLKNFIGDFTNNKASGMCMSVLQKCQNYTYTNDDGTYNNNNAIIKRYLEDTESIIKNNIFSIILEYKSSCIPAVRECLKNNHYYSGDDKQDTAKKACYTYAKTCCSVIGSSCGTEEGAYKALGIEKEKQAESSSVSSATK